MSDSATDEVRIAGYGAFTRLGASGFSTVYRATQERSARVVAVKVLALELRDARSQERFLGEVAVIGPLSEHPNIVHVLDSGFTEQGRPYITSEFMERGSLADRLANDGPMPLDLVLRVGVKVCGAVAAMHALDVMHRDIKPENILMSHFDEPGLADFGIATALAGRVATSGTFSSTPAHAPPEVLEGKGSTPATDVWSLASSLYTLLAGHEPFAGERGEGLYPLMQRILVDPVPPIDRSGVPTLFDQIIAVAMAKDPGERYVSALTFGRVLQGLQEQLGVPVTDMIAPRPEPGDGSITIGTRRRRETIVLEVSGVAELAAARASGEFDVTVFSSPPPPIVEPSPVVARPSHVQARPPLVPNPVSRSAVAAGLSPAVAAGTASVPLGPRTQPNPAPSAPSAPVPAVAPPLPAVAPPTLQTPARPGAPPGSHATVPPHIPIPTGALPGSRTTVPPSSGSVISMATPPLVPVAVPPPASPPPPVPPAMAAGDGTPPSGVTLAPFTSSARRARRRSTSALVAVLVAIALLATASLFVLHGRDGTPSASPGPDAGVEAGCRPRPDRVASLPAVPVAGGTLRFGLMEEGEGWDPRRNGFNNSSVLAATSIYEPIAAFDELGQVRPWLAESITPNADFTEFAITLRRNIRFHDGKSLDADVLLANLEESRTNVLIGQAYAPVAGFSVRDPLTVVVSMKQSWPTFPNVLTGQFSDMVSPTLIGSGLASTKPIGTGPFVFEEWIPGQVLRLVRNERYWGGPSGAGPAHLDAIEFRVIVDDGARQQALANGDIDALITGDPKVIPRLTDGSRGDSVGAIEVVLLNTSRPPFDDITARRALAAATDQRALRAAQQSDLIRPATSPFPSTSRWCVEDAGMVPFDPARAKQLADDYGRATGHPLTFALSVPSSGDRPRLAQQLAGMWAAAGIHADLATGEHHDVLWNYIAGNYEAGLNPLRPTEDPDALYDTYHTAAGGPNSLTAQINVTRLSDPKIDKIVDAGRVSVDPAIRRDAYRALARGLNDVVPMVFLFAVPQAIATSVHVRGAEDLTAPDRSMNRPWSATVWLSPSS